MPGSIKKVDGYRVKWGGKTTAKRTSKKKAQAQLNLLRAVEHGWKPTGKKARKKKRRKR
jgi:hypothetical protein